MGGRLSWGWLLLGVALLVYPFVFTGAFFRDIGVSVLLAAISASAWNIVGGYAGQVSVGHSMFFGAGAYLPLLVYHAVGMAAGARRSASASRSASCSRSSSACRPSGCRAITSAWRRSRSPS